MSDPTGGERQEDSQHRDDDDKPTQTAPIGSGPIAREEPMSPEEKNALNVFHDLQLAYVRQSQAEGRFSTGSQWPKRPDTEASGSNDSIQGGSGQSGDSLPSAALSMSASPPDNAMSDDSKSAYNSSSAPIDFTGQWTGPEKEQVAQAAEKITGLVPDHLQATPWVATCHRSGSVDMYAISRAGLPEVLAARTASGLVEKLRALDAERVRSAAQQASSTGSSNR